MSMYVYTVYTSYTSKQYVFNIRVYSMSLTPNHLFYRRRWNWGMRSSRKGTHAPWRALPPWPAPARRPSRYIYDRVSYIRMYKVSDIRIYRARSHGYDRCILIYDTRTGHGHAMESAAAVARAREEAIEVYIRSLSFRYTYIYDL